MSKVTFLAAQVPYNPTYNWAPIDPQIGNLDIGVVSTDFPGPGPLTTGLQNVNTSILPRPIYAQQLGQIIRAWDAVLGFGEFIYLAVPASTAIPLGTVVSWESAGGLTSAQSASNPLGGGSQYLAIVMPAGTTSANTGAPCAVSVASTVANSGAGITSSTSVQYAWFQLGGNTQVLKTAIQVSPVATEQGAGVYISTTAGRIYITASAGKQILGARLGNTTTVTATASCVLVYLNGRPAIEGK
jgi:hypothetical protein